MGGRASVIMVLGFAAVFAMIQYRLSEVGTEATENMVGYHEEMARHGVAVAGANLGLSLLYQNPDLRGVLATDVPYYGGSFSVKFDSIAVDTFLLTSKGHYAGEETKVEVFLSGVVNQSFSIFAYMTQNEKWMGKNVYFVTGDTIWGRLHTNDVINVYGSPVFMEKVTTAKTFASPPGKGWNQGIYKDGWETGVAAIDFPTDLGNVKAASQSGGYYSPNEIWVILDGKDATNDNGKIYVFDNQADYQEAADEGDMEDYIAVIDINDPLFNGTLYSDQIVHTQGDVDGRLTIASGSHIYLDDDIVYERAPEPGNPSATDDLLGLVSENNVYITDNTANQSDINIHATIFTRTGSFTSENYDTRPVSGYINLIGGIVQDTRGPVGTGKFSGGKVVVLSGFYKRYYFDDRLADNTFRPPSFPGFWSKTLRIASWWE